MFLYQWPENWILNVCNRKSAESEPNDVARLTHNSLLDAQKFQIICVISNAQETCKEIPKGLRWSFSNTYQDETIEETNEEGPRTTTKETIHPTIEVKTDTTAGRSSRWRWISRDITRRFDSGIEEASEEGCSHEGKGTGGTRGMDQGCESTERCCNVGSISDDASRMGELFCNATISP